MTKVVHCKKEPYTVYVGRKSAGMHWGNIASHKNDTLAPIKVETVDQAIEAFNDWIGGRAYQDIEPERRKWILKNYPKLKGYTLGCWCKPGKCHGDLLAMWADSSGGTCTVPEY